MPLHDHVADIIEIAPSHMHSSVIMRVFKSSQITKSLALPRFISLEQNFMNHCDHDQALSLFDSTV